MLLTIDIGNTNIVFGCFKGEDLLYQFRLRTDLERTVDEHAAFFLTLSSRVGKSEARFRHCIISSVVPQLTGVLTEMVRRVSDLEPLLVGPGIKTGVSLKVANPSSLGADRVVNIVAAKKLCGCPAIVIDFGTATTIDYMNKDGDYEGGIICPGLQVAMASLVRHTAQLPGVELIWPKNILGKTTVDQMQVGGVIGYACLVDGLIDRLCEEAGAVSHIVATGGLGALFADHSKKITLYESALTLHGMRVIAEMNF